VAGLCAATTGLTNRRFSLNLFRWLSAERLNAEWRSKGTSEWHNRRWTGI